jgi:hypothetical protein
MKNKLYLRCTINARRDIQLISSLCILAMFGALSACRPTEGGEAFISDKLDQASRAEESFTIQQPSTGVPAIIEYQGYLTDPGGAPRPFEVVDMVFRIYQYESEGNFDWSETHFGVQTGPEGHFRVLLNSTGGASGDLTNLVRSSSQLWLELEVNGETLSPRQPIASVAYALTAPWSGLVGIPADFADGVDNTAGLAGEGLTLSNNIFELSPSYRLPQSCSNNDVPIWDAVSGTWLCGLDSGATYTAGEGLLLDGTQFRVLYGGNGNASSVARSDHDHAGQTWTTAQQAGLNVVNTNPTNDTVAINAQVTGSDSVALNGQAAGNDSTALLGQATGDGKVIGVKGEAGQEWNKEAIGVYGYSVHGIGVYGESTIFDATVTGEMGNYGVYSKGNAHIEGRLSVSENILFQNLPQRSYMIPAQAFTPFQSNAYDGRYPATAEGGLRHYAPSPEGLYLAPVQLPEGSYPKQLTIFYDDHHNEDVTVEFIEVNLEGQRRENTIAQVSSSGKAGPYDKDVGSASVEIQGVGYWPCCNIYYLKLWIPVSDYVLGNYLEFLGARIDYLPPSTIP